jgi:predicted secreted hydrolase
MRRLAALVCACAILCAQALDPVTPGYTLRFPDDRGAHPGFGVEWWYVTGQLESPRGPLGFQVTFFRVRNAAADAAPGRFAPRQVLFAHAALAEIAARRFHHDQRVGRAMEGLVDAREGETDVRIDDWRFARVAGAYRADVPGDGFALRLDLAPTQAVLLEGDRGFSRKGPAAGQASYYYSEPHLRVTGRVLLGKDALDVHGEAWLDHEWSSAYLAPGAAGWDWLGANLDDGGALMAFRIRGTNGAAVWASATWRAADGTTRSFGPRDVAFVPQRRWRSPASGVEYPVAMQVTVDGRAFDVEPLMDAQELDARATAGTLYWEGAVRVQSGGAGRGRGYLELTGYADPLRLP